MDAATIRRFFTFLYVGDYVAPDPEPIRIEHTSDLHTPPKEETNQLDNVVEADTAPALEFAANTPPVEAEGNWPQEESAFIQEAIIEACGPRPLTPISRCLGVGLPPERIQTAAGRLEECSFAYSRYHYGGTLLAHAQVYTFAQYHFVAQLQTFALQRLMQALRYIDCTQAHAVCDITPLIRYVYNNTVHNESREEPI
jgi:hypothetical protein